MNKVKKINNKFKICIILSLLIVTSSVLFILVTPTQASTNPSIIFKNNSNRVMQLNLQAIVAWHGNPVNDAWNIILRPGEEFSDRRAIDAVESLGGNGEIRVRINSANIKINITEDGRAPSHTNLSNPLDFRFWAPFSDDTGRFGFTNYIIEINDDEAAGGFHAFAFESFTATTEIPVVVIRNCEVGRMDLNPDFALDFGGGQFGLSIGDSGSNVWVWYFSDWWQVGLNSFRINERSRINGMHEEYYGWNLYFPVACNDGFRGSVNFMVSPSMTVEPGNAWVDIEEVF